MRCREPTNQVLVQTGYAAADGMGSGMRRIHTWTIPHMQRGADQGQHSSRSAWEAGAGTNSDTHKGPSCTWRPRLTRLGNAGKIELPVTAKKRI